MENPMNKTPKIIITMEGGVIHSIESNTGTEILLLDFDSEGLSPEQLTKGLYDKKEAYPSLLQPDVISDPSFDKEFEYYQNFIKNEQGEQHA
jgi:hypothetical protein